MEIDQLGLVVHHIYIHITYLALFDFPELAEVSDQLIELVDVACRAVLEQCLVHVILMRVALFVRGHGLQLGSESLGTVEVRFSAREAREYRSHMASVYVCL